MLRTIEKIIYSTHQGLTRGYWIRSVDGSVSSKVVYREKHFVLLKYTFYLIKIFLNFVVNFDVNWSKRKGWSCRTQISLQQVEL